MRLEAREYKTGTLDALVNGHVRATLDSFSGDNQQAAKHLGRSERWVQYWRKRYGYQPPAVSPADEIATRIFSA